MGIYSFCDARPCPSIKEQIARQFYTKKTKWRPYRDQDGWGWTKISGTPPMKSTRCGGDETVVVYTEYPPKSGSGDSDISESLKSIESKLVDIADILKELAESCEETAEGIHDVTEGIHDVAEGIRDVVEGINDMTRTAVTAEDMEDVLHYTVVPVIVTDNGPAPKRPENGS